jgi:hypothetical protein
MRRQFQHNLEEELVDNEQSYRWLKFGDIKGQKESTIVAAKDQAVSRIFVNAVLKEELDTKYKHSGSIDNLHTKCNILVENEYLMRHDTVGAGKHSNDRQMVSPEENNQGGKACDNKRNSNYYYYYYS